jgi:predicted enzyme related to lactoylglutathione lyase
LIQVASRNAKGHKSRLTALVIDVLPENYAECVAFWARALGARPPKPPRKNQRYTTLKNAADGLGVLVQRVAKDPGVHLDIETDSVESEATRLEAQGARRKYKIKTWWVLEDPAGMAFCVVRPQAPKKLAKRRPWPAPKATR